MFVSGVAAGVLVVVFKKIFFLFVLLALAIISFSGVHALANDSQLLLYVPFNGSTQDYTCNGFNASLTGGTLGSDYVTFANTDGSTFGDTSSDIDYRGETLNFWFRGSTTGVNQYMWSDIGYADTIAYFKSNNDLQTRILQGTASSSSGGGYLDGSWHMLTIVMNATIGNKYTVYLDGSKIQDTGTVGTGAGSESYTFRFGNIGSSGFVGDVRDFSYWLREFDSADLTSIYNNGITNLDPCGGGGGPTANNVTFEADSDDNATLTYNVTITNGIETFTYNNRQGSTTTYVLDNSSTLWNFTVSADQHFSRTLLNQNVSGGSVTTTLTMWPLINLSDTYNKTTLQEWNITISGDTYTTTTGPLRVPFNNSQSTILRAPRIYFTNTTTVDYTGAQDHNLTITPYTKISVFFANTTAQTIYSYTANLTQNGTTNSYYPVIGEYAYLPIFNEFANITIWNATIYAIDLQILNRTINATDFQRPKSESFYLYTSNTFFIDIRNETTNKVISPNATLQLIGDSWSDEYNVSGGTINLSLLLPQSYTIRYWINPNVPREYYITLINGSIENITLYTIEDADSDLYYPVVTNENGEACPGNTVSLMRHYLDINGYRVVEMAKTDTNGQAVLFVQPQITNYKLLFSGSCGTFTTQPQRITDTTDRFTVTAAQALLTSTEAINNASIAFTYSNTTKTYNFVWSDSTNIVTGACIYVYRHEHFTQTLNYSQCTSGSSGSLIYTLTGNLTETEWSAQAVITTNTQYSDYTFRGPDVDYTTVASKLGITAIFWLLILVLAAVIAFAQDASTMIFTSIGMVVVFVSMGFIAGGGSVVIGLVIVGVVMLYKLRRTD